VQQGPESFPSEKLIRQLFFFLFSATSLLVLNHTVSRARWSLERAREFGYQKAQSHVALYADRATLSLEDDGL